MAAPKTAATTAKKRGLVTFSLTGDADTIYGFNGSYKNYQDVATVLGLTVKEDASDFVTPENKTLLKQTMSQLVMDGIAFPVVLELDSRNGKSSTAKLLVPADKLDQLKQLRGKSWGARKILKARGITQRTITVFG